MTNLDHLDDPQVAELAEVIASLDDDEVDAAMEYFGGRLNPPSVQLLERVVGATGRGWRADPLKFAMRLDIRVPEKIVPFRHMVVMSEQFRKAVRGESRFQIWNLPSQMQKTTSLVLGCAWALDQDPTLPLIYTGYSNDLCRKAAVKIRQIARDHADQLRFQLMPDDQRADAWVTSEGGGVLGHGLHASLAGWPARGVVIDDPLENFQAAHSQAQRDAAWDELVAVARLRLAEGGFLILAHARWHLDDPTGRLKALAAEMGVDVEHIVMPMIQPDAPDPILGREPGEVLEPRRYSFAEARSRAQWLASYRAAALEQQDPQPEEGGELRREWWQMFPAGSAPTVWDEALTSWDTKLKDKKAGDYVVGQVWCRTGADAWLLDSYRGKWTMRQTKIVLGLVQLRWGDITKHVIEAAGYAPEMKAELIKRDDAFTIGADEADELGVASHERAGVEAIIRRGMSGLVMQGVTENKIMRARVHLSPPLEAGNVHIPDDAKGYALQDEAAGFPPKAGGHDDQIDAASQALHHLLHTSAEATIMVNPSQSVTPAKANVRAGTVTPSGVNATILR